MQKLLTDSPPPKKKRGKKVLFVSLNQWHEFEEGLTVFKNSH